MGTENVGRFANVWELGLTVWQGDSRDIREHREDDHERSLSPGNLVGTFGSQVLRMFRETVFPGTKLWEFRELTDSGRSNGKVDRNRGSGSKVAKRRMSHLMEYEEFMGKFMEKMEIRR